MTLRASIVDRFAALLNAKTAEHPERGSFADFLALDAMVPDMERPGAFCPWSFSGRDVMREICETIDTVVKQKLTDSTIVIAGGAQFGKTMLELFLMSYLTSQRWMNVGCYLPDDGLADGIVDTKFRPVVLDNVHWLADMTRIGKTVNRSGKSVNTKNAFLVTDGVRKSVGLFRGLKRIPTSFSLDVVIRDEEDDIPKEQAKFLSSRMTASVLRLNIIVGTQRIHNGGQHRQWERGSQGVALFSDGDGNMVSPEETWPQCCRLDAGRGLSDPRLNHAGTFEDATGRIVGAPKPGQRYYLANPTGARLDMARPTWQHRNPYRIEMRHWSYRISQLCTPAIDLSQIVAHWARACEDSGEMAAFCCDRLAMPRSTAQALSPEIIARARTFEEFSLTP